jgi:hypothetical protein
VKLEAVELCDQALLAPDEIDFVAGDPLVRFRRREAVAFDEPEEVVLEVRAGRGGGGRVGRES